MSTLVFESASGRARTAADCRLDPHAPPLPLIRAALNRLARHSHLAQEEAALVMGAIMDGLVPPAATGALLLALRTKGETVDEIVGCARAIRERALPIPLDPSGLVDTCGTGGDGQRTFNVSTAAAFVAAGAGARVAKHGNRAVSSLTGSADVLEALGVEVGMTGEVAAGALTAAGVTFLFAPTFHAAMRHASPVRKELGVRTVFNLLGPLCNPGRARTQLVGVFDRALVSPVAQALGQLGAERALVVHGIDGLDELTVTGPSYVAEWDGERVTEGLFDPSALGLALRPLDALRGGAAAHNARYLRASIEARGGSGTESSARRDIVALNAAAALLVAGHVRSMREGLIAARDSVGSGAAERSLARLIEYSKGRAGTSHSARPRTASTVTS